MFNLTVIFSFILALLKLLNIISISWFGVFIPVLIYIGILVCCFILYLFAILKAL